MKRLIDADDFKKFLQALCNAGAPYHEIIQLLDKQETAYDVEKVVEELNNAKQYCVPLSGDCFSGVKLDNAIDIVRKGGVG